MARKVLVIGGTLFIGRTLVKQLLERGDDVAILHRGEKNPFEGQAQSLRADRNDAEAVTAAIRGKGFEVVYDNVYDWQRGTTAPPVEAAARACGDSLERYIFTSSVVAYGDGLDLDEDDPLAPADFEDAYCRNKADTERMLFRLHAESSFPAVTLRPPYIYGPGNPFHREQFFWERLDAGRPVIVPGDGSRLMHFVLVNDLVEAALLATDTPAAAGRAYNIANDGPITQADLVRVLAKAAGTEAELVFVEREKLLELGGQVFQPPFYFAQYFDMPPITQKISRARRELGFKPTPFGEGLRRTYAWYKSQQTNTPDFSFDDKVLAATRP